MPAKVDQRLWYVERGSRDGKRKPRLRFVRIESSGPSTVLLRKPFCFDRRRFNWGELEDFGLYVNPGFAFSAFNKSAQHWRDHAQAQVDWAERDLEWYRTVPRERIVALAKEAD